ncbi:MAG: arginyltransferase [Polyangiaceae bacterium]|nr:arginyltransferase [Polyangiaceae bacterium]
MHVLERFIEKPRACAYLPERQASLDVRVMVDVTAADTDALFERGWRRFGPIYFRPACAGCAECVSLRVVAADFTPSKSQRRAKRACERLRRVVGKPVVDDARLALYAKWHAGRERARGWDPNAQSRDRYALEFAYPHPCAREAALYDDDAGGRLVGVGLFDATPTALSAAFFFHDPDYARLSVGTANVVALIDDANAWGRRHVYLGYHVAGCPSLEYKASFRPHERLRASGWV